MATSHAARPSTAPTSPRRSADLVKIDTEGAESLVLRGATNLLAGPKPTIVFESWPGPARRTVFELLNSHGYRIRPLTLRGPVDNVNTMESEQTDFAAQVPNASF